jgi:hypothetical protein
MGTMRKVQAGNVHTGLTHLSQGLLILAGGADGTDDFCLSHTLTSFVGKILVKQQSYNQAFNILSQGNLFVNAFLYQIN